MAQRALPSWMAKTKEEVKQPLNNARKYKAARSVFYCMNEKELLEAASSCLTDGDQQEALLRIHQQVEEKTKETPQKKDESIILQKTTKTKASDESKDGNEDLDATYVSETDLHITELDTVPYTESQQEAATGGQRSQPHPDRGQIKSPHLETEKEKEQPQEDDDCLRLVREIFFT